VSAAAGKGTEEGVSRPGKAPRRWLLVCACGWSAVVPSRELEQQATDVHRQDMSVPVSHSIEVSGTWEG